MTSNHFFINKERITGRILTLEGTEHRHLSRAARCRRGDVVWLFDEEGTRYKVKVEAIGQQTTTLILLERLERPDYGTRILLGQALLKAKAMDLVVQKSTELGVFAILPVIACRSVVLVGDHREKKAERWEKIAREASKQSGWTMVPKVHPPQSLDSFLRTIHADRRIFLHETDGPYFRDLIRAAGDGRPEDVVVLIGPEGGWTEAEKEAILDSGFEAACLGKTVLRAETAAVCAVSILSHFWNL